MIYSFGGFRLDTGQFRLTSDGVPVHVEPLVFDLLRLFVENCGSVVDRDRMLAEVWDGRFVSEATLSTAVKSARRALGDSGEAQAWIETVRGRGFRFKGAVSVEVPARPAPPPEPADEPAPDVPPRSAPSIAVLPFVRHGDGGACPGLEDALPHEVIFALARLRWLFVIARGSSFRFRGPAVDIAVVGRSLGVRYVLTGAVEVAAGRLAVGVELAETESGGVVWGERFEGPLDDVHAVRAEIVRGITAALEVRIQLHEALRAQDRPAENLDAWAAFHLGLKAMHLYTREGNVAADGLFRRAVALEPGFARAHAGLSFVHFQNAFLRHRPGPAGRDRQGGAAGRARAGARPARPVRQLQLRAQPLAAAGSGRGDALAGAGDRAQPELRAGHLLARAARLDVRAQRCRDRGCRPGDRACRRSTRCSTRCARPRRCRGSPTATMPRRRAGPRSRRGRRGRTSSSR